jgi:hypothetical protein
MFGAPLALAGVGMIRVTTRDGITIDPKHVSADLQIDGDERGQFFVCDLYAKPWPAVGQIITTAYREFTFTGKVTRTAMRAAHGTDRFRCRVWGEVQAFNARGLVD